MRTRVLAAVVWMHVLTAAAGSAPKPVQKTRLRFVNTEGLEADTLLRPSSGGSEEAGPEAEDELMTVLKEVISETEDHESPSRITEILTSRGYAEAPAVPHNITRLVAESSALKKVFERLLTKKREARLAAEAAEAAGVEAGPRAGVGPVLRPAADLLSLQVTSAPSSPGVRHLLHLLGSMVTVHHEVVASSRPVFVVSKGHGHCGLWSVQ